MTPDQPPAVLPGFGFLVHDPVMFDHWQEIWRQMDHEEFVIILLDELKGTDQPESSQRQNTELLDKIGRGGHKTVFASEVIDRREKYEFVISNHAVHGSTIEPDIPSIGDGSLSNYYMSNQFISLQLGDTAIRMMYGADLSDGWSLSDWNHQYGFFLCHGPRDEQAVRDRFPGQVFQMGYPRYDRFFQRSIAVQRDEIISEFDLDPALETVVWLPTFGEGTCSIPDYAESVAKLRARFNVLVRPHPLSFRGDPTDIDLLESLHYDIDRMATRDMCPLYASADFVICDYGGTAFSALYLDRNIVQLDVPGAESSDAAPRSTNLELRQLLDPVLNQGDDSLEDLLRDPTVWQRQADQRKDAFSRFFAPYQGVSTQRLIEILRAIRAGTTP